MAYEKESLIFGFDVEEAKTKKRGNMNKVTVMVMGFRMRI
jgi:hypothetical protein